MLKITLKALFGIALLFAAFIGGVFWEHAAQRQEIADIEEVALEACNARVKTIQKLCK